MTPDGTRFVGVVTSSPLPAGAQTRIDVILNWAEELKTKVPVKSTN